MRPGIRTQLAATAVSAALVAGLAGCGPTTPQTEPDDGGSDVTTSRVQVALSQAAAGNFDLTADNIGDAEVLVRAPVGEPQREESDSGVTLTYARPEVRPGGDAEPMYEAFPLGAGEKRVLTTLTFPRRPVTVTYCLEVFDDPGAVADGDIVRAHGRGADEDVALTCSDATTIDE